MGWLCFRRERDLSRYLDGELPLADHRALRAHLQACPRCVRRLRAFQDVDDFVGLLPGAQALRTPHVPRLAIAVAAAAALLASLAANVLTQPEPARRPVFTLPAAPSQNLAGVYASLSEAGR